MNLSVRVCVLVWMCSCVLGAIRTAVFVENPEDYSVFLDLLRTRGHELTIFDDGNNKERAVLEKYGDSMFENIVVLKHDAKSVGGLSKDDLIQFVEKGGNVLIASNIRISKLIRQFALESGVDFAKKGTIVMDHFNRNKKEAAVDTYHSYITTTNILKSPIVVGKELTTGNVKPVAYNGIGMSVDNENFLAFSVLSGMDTTYSASPSKDITSATTSEVHTGRKVSLVTAIQARNNARVLFSGSTDLYHNKFVQDEDTFSNNKLVLSTSKWVFNESGVLKVSNIHHEREDGSLPDKMLSDVKRPDQPITLYPDAEVARDSLVYRIKDNLTYSFDIHEFKNNAWVPFKADDVQLEFVMLDPHVRKTMSHNGKGNFHVTFESPDTYGIFQFRVMYRRLGYTTLHFTTQVSLRPFKHNEYERFIISAFPYYASAFSMMAGVLIFSIAFLYSSDK